MFLCCRVLCALDMAEKALCRVYVVICLLFFINGSRTLMAFLLNDETFANDDENVYMNTWIVYSTYFNYLFKYLRISHVFSFFCNFIWRWCVQIAHLFAYCSIIHNKCYLHHWTYDKNFIIKLICYKMKKKKKKIKKNCYGEHSPLISQLISNQRMGITICFFRFSHECVWLNQPVWNIFQFEDDFLIIIISFFFLLSIPRLVACAIFESIQTICVCSKCISHENGLEPLCFDRPNEILDILWDEAIEM